MRSLGTSITIGGGGTKGCAHKQSLPPPSPSTTKGPCANKRCSLAPYEKRVIELLRNSKDKRARKLAKKRLGTFGRGKRKVDEMTRVIAESKRAGH